ncbi:MAG TPA: Gfo/Idh/MocA family oxidoreductase, partial [Chloroflexota bacterium]|nr:Gfo/Idh/MocA family oxidoreductase [Chloroflexota bacterium]
IRDGAIGRIVKVRLPDVHNKAPNYYERGVGGRARPTQWRASRKTAGGGALIMNAIHQIDVLRFITGLEVERVSAEWVNFTGRAEVEDMINVVLRYDNGAIGTIDTANYAPGGGEAHVLRIYGTRGQLQLERSGLKAYVDEPFADLTVGEWQDVPTERARDSRTLLLEDFVRSVATGAPPPVTARDGRAALQTVLAAYEAAERGRTVRLDELASAVAV